VRTHEYFGLIGEGQRLKTETTSKNQFRECLVKALKMIENKIWKKSHRGTAGGGVKRLEISQYSGCLKGLLISLL